MSLHFFGRFRGMRLVAAAVSILGLAVTLRAQPNTGAVSGRVSDAATGNSLQGAIVRVLGTTAQDYTDAQGRYSLPTVPAGAHRLEIDYVGLDPLVEEITVTPGRPLVVNAALRSDALQMEAFTVAEQARGQALAINQQKTAAGIVNIVSEETFGQMFNGNIGYALQRLPGLTVNQDEDGQPTGVNIRGLESKYNSFQIDGNRIPTSGNSRSFATNQLAAGGVSNIEVIKAPTPDRDGDAIGGIINVTSRSAFQREGRSIQLAAAGIYYDMNEKWGHDVALQFSDLLSVGGGEKNLGVSFTVTTAETSRDYDNLDKDYIYLTPERDPGLGLTEPLYFHTNAAPQTNYRDTETHGFDASIDYRLSDRATFYVRPFYSRYTVDTEKPRNRIYINTNRANIAEATYNTGRSTEGTLNDYRYQNDLSTTDNDTYGLSFGGKHELDTIVFNYDAFYSKNEASRDHSLNYVIRNPGFNVAYDQTDRHEPTYTILNGKSPYDVSTINRGDLTLNPRDAAEEAKSIKADWEKNFAGTALSGALKVGAKYRVNEKEQDQSERIYRTASAASGFPYADLLVPVTAQKLDVPMTLYPDLNKVEALLRSSPHLFALQEGDTLYEDVINDYEAEEDIAAAYVMGTLKWRHTTVIAGLRAEHNTFKSDTYQFNEDTPDAPARVHAERDYTVWLPGIHFRHELRPNLILRESYNRSYARPDIDALVAGLEVNPETGDMTGGNPNLKETTSHNFDIQLEYYTDRGGLYSAGFFYKEMKGFYYETSYNFSTVDASGYPIPDRDGPYEFSTTQNANGAENYGVELIARQNLYFLPAPFDGFGVSLSATFTESDGKYPGREDEELPTYGFSDKIYYAALEYVKGKFRGQISYRYRSDFLEGLDDDNTFDDYFGELESVDWESSYQVTDKLKLFLNVNNITDEPQISYQGLNHSDNPEDYTIYSWRATLGATYTF
ncbi:MAG TPA: TonB-dependent receptor [Opitutaceae bacterium]